MHLKSFDDLIPHMKTAGFVATALAAVITAKFGWQQGEDTISGIALAGLLGLCTFIVGYALVATYHAFKRRLYGVGLMAFLLFSVAAVVEFTSHTGFNAANKAHMIQSASFQTTKAGYAQGNVEDLKKQILRWSEDRSLMKPAAAPAAAQAIIDTSQAHKFWNITANCTATKGPQTRKFCEKYRAAEADVAMWKDIGDLETKIAEAEAQLPAAREQASLIEAGFTPVDAMNDMFASGASLAGQPTTQPTSEAKHWANMGLAAMLALAAVMFGCLTNVIAFAFDAPEPKRQKATHEAANDVESEGIASQAVSAFATVPFVTSAGRTINIARPVNFYDKVAA